MFRRAMRSHRRRETSRSSIDRAIGRVLEPLERRVLLAVTLTPEHNWIDQGPRGITNSDGLDSGAVQSIAVHPNFTNLAYAATVNGGVWKTTNFLDPQPNWTPLTDFMPGLSMGPITFSPISPAGTTVFAGTGAFSSQSRSAGLLYGILRTTDGGAHWESFWGAGESGGDFGRSQLSIGNIVATDVDDAGAATTDLDKSLVLIAAVDHNTDRDNKDEGGIYRSIDGGRTVTRVFKGSATDVIADPTDKKRFYAGVISAEVGEAGIGLYQSVDAGKTWQSKNIGLTAGDFDDLLRVDLEASAAPGNPIYAALIRKLRVTEGGKTLDKNRVGAIARFNNLTGMWSKANNVPNVNDGGQAQVHFSMVPDPFDGDVLYLAGDSHAVGPRGDVRRFDTVDGTSQTLVQEGAFGTTPHADSRDMQFVTDGDKHYLVDANDGGVYRFLLNGPNPADSTFQRWIGLNRTMGVTEMVSVTYDVINKRIFTGNIDNGTIFQPTTDALAWTETPLGGDGFAQAYAQEFDNSNVLTGARWYSLQNNFGSFYRRLFNPDGTDVPGALTIALAMPGKNITRDQFGVPANHLSGLTPGDKRDVDNGDAYYAPMVVNAAKKHRNRVLLGRKGLYESDNFGDYVRIIDNGKTAAGKDKDQISALAYGHETNPAIIYAARGGTLSVSDAFATPGKPRKLVEHKVQVLDNGNVTVSAGTIQDVVIDPADWKTVYVIDSVDIFKSTDAGKTWTHLDRVPSRPPPLTSLVVLPGATPQSRLLVVSSHEGVFYNRETSGQIFGQWLRLGNQLPRAVVSDLHYVPEEDLLIAGTLGRGAWTLKNLSTSLTQPTLNIQGTSAADDIVISRSDDNPELVTVTINGEVQGSWDRRVTSNITVMGGDGNDVVRILADDGGVDPTNGNGSFLPPFFIEVQGGTSAGDTNNQVIVTGPGTTLNTTTTLVDIKTLDNHSLTVLAGAGVTIVNNVPQQQANVSTVGVAMQRVVQWSRDIRNAVQGKVAGVQDAFGDFLNGVRENVGLPFKGADGKVLSGAFVDAGGEFLRRLFEEGTGGFDLTAIGAPGGGISTAAELRDRLLALDDDPSTTVTLVTDANGNPTYDLTLVKRLEGTAGFDVELADGLISLGGTATLSADVRLHMIFGIDADGFFIAAEQNAEPEITISNISGSIDCDGRVGFIGVTLADGTFTFDSDVKLTVNLHDPGTIAEDGLIRLNELTGLSNELVTVGLQGDAADGLNDDIRFNGDLTVDLFDITLPSMSIELRWANAEQVDNVTFNLGASLQSLLDVDVTNFVDTVLDAAEHLREITGVDVFAQKIPLLEKSVNDLLGGDAVESFGDAAIADISDVFQEGGFNKFQVALNDINAAARGIVAGNTVTFIDSNGAEQAGVVDSVGDGGFVVRFDISNTATPKEGTDESVKVTHPASVRDQISAILGDLANPIGLAGRIPTLQDLGDALGVDLSQVKLSADGGAIEIPFAFSLDPIHFARKLDLAGRIAGLNLSAAGDIDVEISPSFAFTAGVRFGSGVPLTERIYLKENDDAEVTLGVKVTLDDPTAAGSIGFLNVALSEDTPNDGISFLGQLKLNLTDPGTGDGDDGRIVLSELTPINLLTSFDASISADVVINPIKIVATIGDSTELGKITIQLDAADGHIASLADLLALPGKIQIAGATAFENFNNITPQMIIDAIEALIEKLRSIGGGGVLDTKLPVIDKSLSEIVDLGEKFAQDIGLLDPSGAVNAQKFEEFLESKLGGNVDVVIKSDAIQFALSFAETLNESFPVSLNLGDDFGLLSVEGGGVVNFTGSAAANITFGLLTGANIPIAQRLFFDTDGADASKITISGGANIGYGGGSDPGFDATVKLGFLEFGVQDARALLELTQLLGQLKDPGNTAGEGAGRLTFQEIADKIAAQQFTQILDGTYTGRVQARIPLDGADVGNTVTFPLSSTDALIEVAGKLENITNLVFADPGLHADSATPLTAAELDPTRLLVFQHNLDNLIASAVLDFDNLLAGLEKLIEWGDKLLGLGVLDFELPFTGAKIRDALNFFKDPDGPIQTLIDAINSSGALGPKPTDAAAQVAANQIEDVLAGIPGLSPVVPGGNILNLVHDLNGRLFGATFKFRLSLPFTLPLPQAKFDLGLDFLDVNADLDLAVSGFVDVLFGLGIDKSNNGFYLITHFPEAGPNAPELAIRNVRLSLAGSALVDIGFLELGAAFDPLKNFMQANLSVDINGLGDDRLTLSELADFSRLPAAVDGNPGTPELDGLRLDVEAKMDVPLSIASHPDFPSLSTNFVLQWGPFTLNDVRTGSAAFTTPLVALNDLTLNAGEFLSKQALPFFQGIQQYNVLAPLIDKLDDPLPIIGGTLFDLLVTNNPALSQEQRNVAGFLFNVGKTIGDFTDGINAGGDQLVINFGDIVINRDQSITTSGGAAPVGPSAAAAGPYPGQSLPVVGGLIEDLGDIGIVFPMLEVGNLIQLFMGKDVDLIFANLPQLNAGKEFNEEIPIYSVGIPYIASATINALFGGSINLEVNLAAGLDSSGISKGLSHILDGLYIGDFDPGSDGRINAGDAERPEVLLEAYVTAGINAKAELLGFDLLKITGKAKFGGNVGLDLNDDNDNILPPLDPRTTEQRSDGKFYISEIGTVINSAGGDVFCMFDIVGSLFAELGFEISVPLAPNPDWSHRWTLVEFDIECEPDPIFPDFADIVDDGAGGKMLRLTSTPGDSHVAYHSFSATNHADGDPIEIFLIDKNGNPDDGNETLRIRKHGFTEDFGPGESGNNLIADITTLTLITDEGTGTGKFRLSDFGAGSDYVLVDAAIKIPVRLDGGTENDTLTGGNGGGTLLGGDGDDYLSLAEAPAGLSDAERALRSALFNGGNGADQIVGGVGNDVAIGAEGNDTVDGGEGDDILVGGGGDDVLDGGSGHDRIIGDYDESGHARPATGAEEGSDFISGGTGPDFIWGDNRGTTNDADGPAPDPARLTGDFIFAGDGSDLVFAGAGNDRVEAGAADAAEGPNRVFGGTGDDVIVGGANADSLVGNAGNDDIDAGADNDQLYAGDDTFGPNLANQGFDRLTGGAGDDLVDGSDADAVTAFGNAGVDRIVGSRGGDDLSGNEHGDFILAGPGNDLVAGGDGDDDIVGGDGTVGGFTVDFTESDGADLIGGDAGADIVLGDNGSIDATTRAASTTASGGFGVDVVNGGAEFDVILGGGAGDILNQDADGGIIIGDLGSVDAAAVAVTPSSTGGADVITGSTIGDIIIGGDAGDVIDAGAGDDLIFGDYGIVDRTAAANISFTSSHTTATTGGNDRVTSGGGDDTAIGGQGADQMSGGDDNDDLIGGHNVAAGHDDADAIDGGAGYDVIAGDNASIVRRSDNQSRNTRALAGATLYTATGAPNVTSNFQVNLDGAVGRDITLFDHTATTDVALFGDDHLAGGAGHDSIFGQLGNDRLQGDGSTALNVSATQPSASSATDGNDYMEGGGGADLLFGNGGQDDLIGGSSNLFGLADGQRPDGADVIFGGSGDDALRNALGDTTPGGHARDADVILGDNGNIFRIVSSDGAGTYKTFNYDDYAGGLRIIPRAVALLDYSADGDAANDIGGGDRLHGEAGDDSIHGMSADDFLTGDGQDDHLFGESGDDWLSGGAGDDGMLGDDGKIMTSRNGTAEPLYGVAATTQQFIEVKNLQMTATINVTGQLKHGVDLEPFAIGGADVMYGGLGNDAMHGGAGQDLMSGAEALAEFYLPAVAPALVFADGKFELFSFATPTAKVAGHPLNFEAFIGTLDNIVHDGNDVLFGDGGNDWLVGGTDTDRLYGGYGDDLLSADDNLETDGGANTSPDAAPYAGADYAFGGAGRDSLIGNAPEDRLIDWVGEFNGYYVPFNPFGQSTVVRQISSQLVTFLYQLSKSDGADQTRIGPGLGTAARNGEPFGELGLVIQQDPDWHDQNGPPIGPQPQ